MAVFLALVPVLAGAGSLQAAETGSITVSVSGLSNENAGCIIALFNEKKGFPAKTARAARTLTIPSGVTSARFDAVPYGTYALTIFHDRNGNGRLDANFLGMPKEGVGTSNNPRTSFGPPSFNDASFLLDAPEKAIRVNMRYL
ncbi:DUF2141 domain-containing protein [Pelodictyon luteolum]|uniref:DUF2141 domain-containing protein n=1 Tax=Pelodictyon luteolum TaxID=1100 RepID=UPI000302FCE9|nr:DUF2141 domain-containing protein [Pelodictyon luteolum]